MRDVIQAQQRTKSWCAEGIETQDSGCNKFSCLPTVQIIWIFPSQHWIACRHHDNAAPRQPVYNLRPGTGKRTSIRRNSAGIRSAWDVDSQESKIHMTNQTTFETSENYNSTTPKDHTKVQVLYHLWLSLQLYFREISSSFPLIPKNCGFVTSAIWQDSK